MFKGEKEREYVLTIFFFLQHVRSSQYFFIARNRFSTTSNISQVVLRSMKIHGGNPLQTTIRGKKY
jgi:hypothetical protein